MHRRNLLAPRTQTPALRTARLRNGRPTPDRGLTRRTGALRWSQTPADRQPAVARPSAAVCCLGHFTLAVDGVEVTSWTSGKARQLFQYLVINRNRPNPREALMEALWPNPEAVAPETSLKVAAHALRQTLKQVPDSLNLGIHTSGTGYMLSAPNLWLDVEEFQRLSAEAHALERKDDQNAALAAHRSAVALYKGPFIAELYDDWTMLRREALKDQYLLSLGRLADAAFDHRDYLGCLLDSQRLLEHDPCREDAYRRIMVCHARLGQPSRVRSWYELCVRTIRAELDGEPEPETRWIFERAMRGEFAIQLADA
jgi:DNA-binding SARP family transcriptional activator